MFDTAGSSTYTYLLADPTTKEALLIDPVLEMVSHTRTHPTQPLPFISLRPHRTRSPTLITLGLCVPGEPPNITFWRRGLLCRALSLVELDTDTSALRASGSATSSSAVL
jgi:hypothetical protein